MRVRAQSSPRGPRRSPPRPRWAGHGSAAPRRSSRPRVGVPAGSGCGDLVGCPTGSSFPRRAVPGRTRQRIGVGDLAPVDHDRDRRRPVGDHVGDLAQPRRLVAPRAAGTTTTCVWLRSSPTRPSSVAAAPGIGTVPSAATPTSGKRCGALLEPGDPPTPPESVPPSERRGVPVVEQGVPPSAGRGPAVRGRTRPWRPHHRRARVPDGAGAAGAPRGADGMSRMCPTRIRAGRTEPDEPFTTGGRRDVASSTSVVRWGTETGRHPHRHHDLGAGLVRQLCRAVDDDVRPLHGRSSARNGCSSASHSCQNASCSRPAAVASPRRRPRRRPGRPAPRSARRSTRRRPLRPIPTPRRRPAGARRAR